MLRMMILSLALRIDKTIFIDDAEVPDDGGIEDDEEFLAMNDMYWFDYDYVQIFDPMRPVPFLFGWRIRACMVINWLGAELIMHRHSYRVRCARLSRSYGPGVEDVSIKPSRRSPSVF